MTKSVTSSALRIASLAVAALFIFSGQVAHAASATAAYGKRVTLSVAANGTSPFNYQWKKDGVNIGGAVANTYVIQSALAYDAGSYTVVVSNAAGSTTSDVGTLIVTTLSGNAMAHGVTNFPLSATASTVTNFSYTVSNTGTKVWGTNHYLALMRSDGSIVQMLDVSGTALGASKTVTFSLPTPGSAGTYQYRVQELENGLEWFGVPTVLTLNVTSTVPSSQGNALAYAIHDFPLSASAGSVVNFTYSTANSGTRAWGANHYLALMQSDYTLVQLGSLATTAPGGSKSVSLSLPVPATPGTYQYRLQALENGLEWFGSPTTLTLIVTPAVVTSQGNALAYGTNSFPLSASAGSVVNFSYNVSNLGTSTWGANHFLALLDSGFNLIEFSDLNGIAAGGSTTANFSFPVPTTPGTYQYIVRPLENGVEWFGTQLSMTLIVTPAVVSGQGNALAYGTTTFPVTVSAGASVNFVYNTTNFGTKAWGVNHYLALMDTSYNLIDFADLNATAAGANKAASFNFTAPASPGTYQYVIRPLENGLEWFGTEVRVVLTVQ